jgi:coproporphyrinogen III oxidase
MSATEEERRPIVYIPNKSDQDFSDAARFGDPLYLTTELVNPYGTNTIHRLIAKRMKDVSPSDYILVSSLNILTAIASGVMAYRTGQANFLLYRRGKYVERTLAFSVS